MLRPTAAGHPPGWHTATLLQKVAPLNETAAGPGPGHLWGHRTVCGLGRVAHLCPEKPLCRPQGPSICQAAWCCPGQACFLPHKKARQV